MKGVAIGSFILGLAVMYLVLSLVNSPQSIANTIEIHQLCDHLSDKELLEQFSFDIPNQTMPQRQVLDIIGKRHLHSVRVGLDDASLVTHVYWYGNSRPRMVFVFFKDGRFVKGVVSHIQSDGSEGERISFEDILQS